MPARRALAWLETTNVTNTTRVFQSKRRIKMGRDDLCGSGFAAVVTLVQYIMVYLGSRDRN